MFAELFCDGRDERLRAGGARETKSETGHKRLVVDSLPVRYFPKASDRVNDSSTTIYDDNTETQIMVTIALCRHGSTALPISH